MRSLIMIFIFISIEVSVFAQMKIAQIEDKDNYANIRCGKGKTYEIVGTINNEEFFYCEISDTSNWYKVIALKWNKGNQITGYIQKSRIKIIENLPVYEQQEIIEMTLEVQKELADEFIESFLKYDRTNNKWHSKTDSLAYRKTGAKLDAYSETNYNAILKVLPVYFCETNDRLIIQLLFDTMWADRGSASESPSFSIGKCFFCNSDLLIELLQQAINKDKKENLINQIDWGLQNIFWTEEDGENEPSNKEYIKLRNKLENIK